MSNNEKMPVEKFGEWFTKLRKTEESYLIIGHSGDDVETSDSEGD